MALVGPVFLDTTVLLAGLIDMGEATAAAQAIMTAIAEQRLKRVMTAWHCCLEFYSVATRLPAELRLQPADALELLEREIVGRLNIVDLPAHERARLLRDAAHDDVRGGRVYDLHIAETARAHRAKLVVTDNRRHFAPLLRYDIRVLSPTELISELGG